MVDTQTLLEEEKYEISTTAYSQKYSNWYYSSTGVAVYRGKQENTKSLSDNELPDINSILDNTGSEIECMFL